MKRVHVCTFMLIPFFLAHSISVYAQVKSGEASFDRNDKVLSWKTSNNGAFNLSDKMKLDMESLMTTSLNMTTGKGVSDRWYDTVYNRAELGYKYSEKMDFNFAAREDWNRDTMSRFGKSLLNSTFSGGLGYKPISDLTFKAAATQIYDRRFDNTDRGTQLNGGALYNGRPLKNMSMALDMNGSTTNLTRANDVSNVSGRLGYAHEFGRVSLSLADKRNLRGYYSDIDGKKTEERERVEQSLSLGYSRGDFFNYHDATAFEVSLNMDRRNIGDSANNKKESSKYQNNSKGRMNGFQVRLGRGLWESASTEWQVDYEKNDNGVERLTRQRTQTDIAAKGSFFIGLTKADSLEVVGWVKRTRIDTPEEVTNDRDEYKFESGILYTRLLSENCKTALDFRVLETHYVNIDVSQSSQNKWMKTYLLSPSLEYRPLKSFQISHVVNLYANHNTYDFDSKVMPRSNISRRVSYESWMNIQPSSRTGMRIGVMVEDNDYGNLKSDGSKIPAEEGIKRFGDISLEYIFTDWLTINPHYVYAVRQDWLLSGESSEQLRREIDQTYGLDCRLFSNDNGNILLRFKRIVRNTDKYSVRIRNYITVTIRYGF